MTTGRRRGAEATARGLMVAAGVVASLTGACGAAPPDAPPDCATSPAAGSPSPTGPAKSPARLVAIDPRTDHVIGRYHPAGAAYPHGLLVDAPQGPLFVANQRVATLSIVDLQTMQVLGTEPIGRIPDVLAFDPAWRRLYVASESGVVSVFTELGRGLTLDGELTMPHAHTVAADPRTHLVYFPLQDLAGQPVLRIMSGTPPPPAGLRRGAMGPRASGTILRRMGAHRAFAAR